MFISATLPYQNQTPFIETELDVLHHPQSFDAPVSQLPSLISILKIDMVPPYRKTKNSNGRPPSNLSSSKYTENFTSHYSGQLVLPQDDTFTLWNSDFYFPYLNSSSIQNIQLRLNPLLATALDKSLNQFSPSSDEHQS